LNVATKTIVRLLEKEIVNAYSYLHDYQDSEAQSWFSKKSWNLFKDVDLLELWMFCDEEKILGNKDDNILKVIKTCRDILIVSNSSFIRTEIKTRE